MNSSDSKTSQTLAEKDPLRPLTELANLRDNAADFERFANRWPGFVHVCDLPGHGLVEMLFNRREALRRIWRGNSDLILNALLLPEDPPAEFQDSVDYIERDETGHPIGWEWPPQVNLDWQRGQFVYEPRTEFQKALHLLFRQSARVKVCGNPDCPAPYFVAGKTTQRYCSDKCAEVFQRECKRAWWAAHGDEWRRSRKKSRRKSGGKR